jgi:hypothetical protein
MAKRRMAKQRMAKQRTRASGLNMAQDHRAAERGAFE